MNFKFHLAVLMLLTSLITPGKTLYAAGPSGLENVDLRSYHLGGIATWSEVVSIGIKKMALSSAMSAQDMDKLLETAQGIVKKAEVSSYRETNFLASDLFPLSTTEGKQVLIIYKGKTLDDYLSLKKRKAKLLAAGNYDAAARKEIAWALGKLLSYPDARITQLLNRNTNTDQ